MGRFSGYVVVLFILYDEFSDFHINALFLARRSSRVELA